MSDTETDTPKDCFCGGDRPNWEYHHPDGCAAKPLPEDLSHD